MSDRDLDWKFAEEFVPEPPGAEEARARSVEHGVEAISPATGAQLAVLAAAVGASTVIELGTGFGVSGIWTLHGATQEAMLTSIDVEAEYHESARQSFTEAGHPPARVRLIGGRALDVLPRMNDRSYDLVVIDADPENLLAYVEHGLRLARAGGVVAVPHALWKSQVADPARRDDPVGAFRALLSATTESNAVAALSTVGDGLLQLVVR